ncbi:PilN domain-containing protein [Marinobacterium mangrovicola]|uniref:Type IV pilus assembly protein PilN n=1 Tax=Marinobacterium mangrovicola TaxID=1476959 RepID=A0A4R1GKC9_9GAMM|nr:PilN domain-containing protein [Marinobacterium mangrovicola]TCK04752.1 type IV pilus assembly protein PilN [Marinobacterium mangrovicola]
MARINLRPWREERNALLQKRFLGNLVAAAVLAAVTVFAVSYYYDMQMDRQQARNNYLRGEISKLDQKIAEISELRRKRERLLERLNAIQELQGNRPVIVRNFDELVRVLPDDLYYSSLTRTGDRIGINGLANDNDDVSTLMRNLEGSIWFGEPSLSRVQASNQMREFNLSVPLAKPKAEETGK